MAENNLEIELDEVNDGEEEFMQAANFLQHNTNTIEQNNLLELYGLYKQATIGKCNTSKPSIFSLQAKSKWNAWNSLGDMTQIKAMEMYVQKVKQLFPEALFIERNNWVAVSSMKNPDDDETIPDSNKNAFDFVKESNSDQLKDILTKLSSEEINELDESGLGLIHWAADRGDSKVLEILIENGADIDGQDGDGQTAMHYAASCGNLDCIKVLKNYDANLTIRDNENLNCFDVALDDSVVSCLNS